MGNAVIKYQEGFVVDAQGGGEGPILPFALKSPIEALPSVSKAVH